MAGLTSNPFMGAYTVAKHGVVALSEVMAKELELVGARVGVSVLCPGFVRTQIHKSERNRPGEQRSVSDSPGQAAVLTQMVAQLVETGQSPDAVAERVASAVRENRFYVLTHPEMKPAIEHRMRDVLDERPPGIDPLFRQLASRG
jgi:short-subunit dehydrogenase